MYKHLSRSILTSLIGVFGLSISIQADPYTEILLGNSIDNRAINEYYKKHHINDKESLVVIGSHYKESETPIAGTGFTLQSENKKYIITNSHLIDGDNKFYIHQGTLYPIQENMALSCANHDIAVIEISEEIVEAFGIYDKENNDLYTHGMNNSPRSHIKDEFTFNEEKSINYNNRPLFENLITQEVLSYVQIGNMYDLSCNYYPSSPEPYKGNALFVPISEAIKAITNEPIPYKQNHHNQIGIMNSIMDLAVHNQCRINLDSKVREHEKSRQSFLSKSIITPSSIVPGMSGSPLLQNNDLKQSKYKIAGIATSYDRIMQKSIFSSHSNIKECLNNFLDGKRGHLDSVKFKYSKKYQSTYRQKVTDSIIEEIPDTHGKANADLTDTKIKELYELHLAKKKELEINNDNRANSGTIQIINNFNGGHKNEAKNQTIIRGGNGYGNGGGPLYSGKLNFRERINIPTGLSIDGDLVIGFKCLKPTKKGSYDYIFANWEGHTYSELSKCEMINSHNVVDLKTMLQQRIKNYKSNSDENTERTFSVTSNLKIKENEIVLTFSGKYHKKKYKKSINIKNDLKLLKPRIEVELDKRFSIIIDIKELFFTDMLNITRRSRSENITQALKRDSKPRVLYSLKEKTSTKGSIPLINTWR